MIQITFLPACWSEHQYGQEKKQPQYLSCLAEGHMYLRGIDNYAVSIANKWHPEKQLEIISPLLRGSAMDSKQHAVIIEPRYSHKASVIWLHGLGADGHDFEPIVPELHLPDNLGIRFIFPHAPVRPVTINGGMAMRAWYDVRGSDLSKQEDAVSIEDSARILDSYINAELAEGIAAGKIVIAGFSQGGAIILHAGLRYPERLAGLLALSTYLPLPDRLAGEAHPENAAVPIMMLHGTFDPVIPVTLGKRSCDFLQQSGYPVEWRTYPMQHAVCPQEIRDISLWLKTRLGD